jgi:putative ABC transport system substrate-binding protein
MRRREFITLLGGAAAWPLAVRAQQPSARIGFLRAAPPPDATLMALRRGLAELGYVEGQRYTLVPSWADGNREHLPDLARALVLQGVDIIIADGTDTARAAKAATESIPVVMAGGLDPVQGGLAKTLSRPGGNVTGFTTQVIDTTGKAFELVSELIVGITRIAVINPKGGGFPFRAAEAEAAKRLKLDLRYVDIDDLNAEAIDAAIRTAAAQGAQAAIMRGSPFMSTPQRRLAVESARTHRLPTMCETREWVELGGLLSYGTDFSALFRQAAGYIVRILNGVKPADLPFEQANKFELVINLKTAMALALTVPPTLIARADEVME